MKSQFIIILFFASTISVLAQELTLAQKDSIKAVLEKMQESDQRYRTQLTLGELDSTRLDSINKLPLSVQKTIIESYLKGERGFSVTVRDSLWQLQSEIDSLNKLTLLTIISKYGYPSYRRAGSTAASIITIHLVGPEDFKELLPIFKKELKKGNMTANDFACWYDRCQLLMGKKQLYGQYDSRNRCVENLKITNKERKKIGLYKITDNPCRE